MSKDASTRPLASVVIDGTNLTVEQVMAVARKHMPVKLSASGRKRAADAHRVMVKIVRQQPVYGQTTGVGANKDTAVDMTSANDHGRRLLRSHVAGAGPAMEPELVRAMLVVRLNQLAAGGSGVQPNILAVLAEALNKNVLPAVKRYGGIGTGDITALATTLLCIIGERPWQNGRLPAYALGETDALAFISSNAATLGEAAIATHDLKQRFQASLFIAALSHRALGGSAEPFAERVQAAKPHRGQATVAAELRRLLHGNQEIPARRIQDPYGLRALTQVSGPAADALERMTQILQIELNATAENPVVTTHPESIFHNGNFHASYVGLALDELRAAIYGTAALSIARLGLLMEPSATGLRPFLAAGSPGSSGVLALEYTAQSALAEQRHLAMPDSLGTAVLSRGTEEHASFATQAAWHTNASVMPYETVLACELIAAVRALRQQNIVLAPGPLREVFDQAAGRLNADMTDRPLDTDLTSAIECLRQF